MVTIDLTDEEALEIAKQAMENIARRRGGESVPTGHLPPFEDALAKPEPEPLPGCEMERCSRFGDDRLKCLRAECPYSQRDVDKG